MTQLDSTVITRHYQEKTYCTIYEHKPELGMTLLCQPIGLLEVISN